MNLTKRLQEAAERRANEPPPLPVIDLGRGRDRSVTIHLDPVPPEAIDLRTAEPPQPRPEPQPTRPVVQAAPAPQEQRRRPRWRTVLARLMPRRDRDVSVTAVDEDQVIRARRLADVPPSARVCPRCGDLARLDINDRTRGVLHLSCDGCFKMWQVEHLPTPPTVTAPMPPPMTTPPHGT